ncbi:tetratricopeptide repeat protein [Legionella shakespearei]|uniref:Methyltransferase n=1 Tax=Legionella shakespearei DSM 23087 TaxID=1122169 RepID=A0A0W0YT69_9GAMM|nr:tetratricopeptide repeat protein [Legionella shakespearei]KTD60069.1 methyltransferase [Legionella shakespearei DSM 23087]
MKLLSILSLFLFVSAHAEPVILCDAENGLKLINKQYYSAAQIEMILNSCDKVSPNAPSVLLLHALFARKNNQLEESIQWLIKARTIAPQNVSIIMELATSYELAKQWQQALETYQFIVNNDPYNRAALLGEARILRLEKQYQPAAKIYQAFLDHDPQDADALNGMGWISAAQNDLSKASTYFNQTLAIQPENSEALAALKEIKRTELQQQGPPILCDTAMGFIFLNQPVDPTAKINEILQQCTKNGIENQDTFLLQGLLARKNKDYKNALFWLNKAVAASPATNQRSSFELATTYEWDNQPQKALLVYQNILSQSPENRIALLGEARNFKALKQYAQANTIYQQLLAKNPKDIDVLNGMGWLALAQNQKEDAKKFFQQSLSLEAQNVEAIQGLKDSNIIPPKIPGVATLPPRMSLCDADTGLMLLNKIPLPLGQIRSILNRCDKNTPDAPANLLLHGLLARHLAVESGDYQSAIQWLTKAMQNSNEDTPVLELAVTYEWAGNFKNALALYRSLLAKNPKNQAALLGEARVLRFSYQIQPALQLYQRILASSPGNIQALGGLGETYMANYDFDKARSLFHQVLRVDPKNKQVQDDLQRLDLATKNVLDFTIGDYSVPPEQANGFNLNYFRNLNATDGLNIYATHNTRQIESNFGAGPTLLPNNSLLLGYQRLVPQQYGWQLSYDARQHDHLPFENRVYGGANLFLKNNLEWFGGLRLIFPDLWNTQLISSGFTAYTSWPFNVTATGFWAFQEIGGFNSSYALDFSKEYLNHFFYDIGPSYLVEQESWEVHGRLVVPVFKNQALLAQCSHYFFNRSTFITAGWRVYWA